MIKRRSYGTARQAVLAWVLWSGMLITGMAAMGSDAAAALIPADQEPLGERTPLVLVHGNNQEDRDQFRWGVFLEVARRDAEFSSRFKPYLFRYDSELRNAVNGLALGDAVAGTPEVAGRSLVILGYSRGGIVARYYMNDFRLADGRPAGEKVTHLVTLGTPHRGSPGADPALTLFSFDYHHEDALVPLLTTFYDNVHLTDSDLHLLWDDAEDLLTKDVVCWQHGASTEICRAPYSKFGDIRSLNRRERYADKITAFGSNNYNGEAVSSFDMEEVVDDTEEWLSHEGLRVFSALMAEIPVIPSGYPQTPIDDSYEPFRANDGLVPLASALFLKTNAEDVFTVNSQGIVSYDEGRLQSLCRAGQCHVVPWRADHLHFLDWEQLIQYVVDRLKGLNP